ncbi:MAG: N-formylglutamate amidohydrolase [Myxococcales bacterium]|nr:N-formylglutamate amidohydrolase [Myxococcales bacterium]
MTADAPAAGQDHSPFPGDWGRSGSVYFSVKEPTGPETPVVVEVPHAGLFIDPMSLATLVAPARAIGQDADLFVDELYADAPSEGATLLVSKVSRYVCDLNRADNDVDALTIEGAAGRSSPHGLVWRATTENTPALSGPLSRAELERRLRDIYRPYHGTLTRLLELKRERFGFAILLCGHSMPSRGRAGNSDPGRPRADVVPGSRGRTSAAEEVIAVPDELARQRGWSVAHDDPYRGGFSTAHYGRPRSGIHAVQVELTRKLYMHESTLEKKANDFEATRAYCRAVVARLGGVALA